VTTTQIADGTITSADVATAGISNANLASDTARLNLLTNGGFEIWQRGNGPFTAQGAFTADRWQIFLIGADTLSVSRDTTNMDGSGACAACTYAVSGGTATMLYAQIKFAGDYSSMAGRTVSLSVRVRTSTANAARVQLLGDGGITTQSSAYHTGSGAYQTLSVTLAIPTASTYIQCAVNFTASCTAYIDNAMLVVGSQYADYVPLHPADDLARCLRYYEVVGFGTGAPCMNGSGVGTTQIFASAPIFYKTRKAVMPTVTAYGTYNAQIGSGAGMQAASVSAGQATQDTCGFSVTFASGVSNGASYLLMPTGGGAGFWMEANP
jgi:hypothetical protein